MQVSVDDGTTVLRVFLVTRICVMTSRPLILCITIDVEFTDVHNPRNATPSALSFQVFISSTCFTGPSSAQSAAHSHTAPTGRGLGLCAVQC